MSTFCVVIDIPTEQTELQLRRRFEQTVSVPWELRLEQRRHFERTVCFLGEQEKKHITDIVRSTYAGFEPEQQSSFSEGPIGQDNYFAAEPSVRSNAGVVIDIPIEPAELERRRHFERTVCFQVENEANRKSSTVNPVRQDTATAGPSKKDDHIAAGPYDRSKELGLPASATMEEIMRAIIEKKRLCNVMWVDSIHCAGVSGKGALSFYKVTFPVKMDKLFGEVMNMLEAWGIGQRYMSQVFVMPCTYYHGQPPATVAESEGPSDKPRESYP